MRRAREMAVVGVHSNTSSRNQGVDTGEWPKVLRRPRPSEQVYKKSAKPLLEGASQAQPCREVPAPRAWRGAKPQKLLGQCAEPRDTPTTQDSETAARSLLEQLLPKKQVFTCDPRLGLPKHD